MFKMEGNSYILEEPSKEKWETKMLGKLDSHSPGTKIDISNDKSLIEISHYYIDKTVGIEVTQIVGIHKDKLNALINILQKIKRELNPKQRVLHYKPDHCGEIGFSSEYTDKPEEVTVCLASRRKNKRSL